MKLYNTLTRNIETVTPLHDSHIGVYTCGPTVYDFAHVGHWFNYVRMDTLIRALNLSGHNTKWVMNVTDVGHLVSDADEGEDKLEKGARREGKTAWEVAEFYAQDFLEGMALLNISQPDHIVKATEHIPEQIALIKKLEEKNFTYIIDDGVYYDTSMFEGYEAFAKLDLDEQMAGARVQLNEQKRNTTDFALWKFSPQGQQRDMEWDSPWGKGFPGWHIECSAMSMKYLGETLDIHTGGIDHIPVHHTNEIAQSEAATGKRFANYWMHSNHVTVNGEKISKSLGNGIRIQEIIRRGISPVAVRLHILESHYRSQSKFSWESLEAAQNRLDGFYEVAALRWQVVPSVGEHVRTQVDTSDSDIIAPMLEDLDTPALLANINQHLAKLAEQLVQEDEQAAFARYLEQIDSALGLDLSLQPDISPQQKALIAQRQQAREQKDWTESDTLRDKLLQQGIAVRDTQHGPVWYRVRTGE